MSYAQIAIHVPVSKATIDRILKRYRLNRLAQLSAPPPPVIRYEHKKPGALIHLDMKKLGAFHKPGVRGTGNRADRNEGAGTESIHEAIDDHSRLGFACVYKDETIPSVLSALHQVVSYLRFHHIKIKRILTDNCPAYKSRAFASAVRDRAGALRFR